ncbi:hypothetical protein TRFO_37602 [Tritrichomonas foetus]|uniref:BEACH domain-containing protein n=1 Tax=Tritrichomonas foetus TaxID=1144522 RepID=A0A1J4JAP2_9EUKA|nr:hypothetical protein TRFO_37602 [Tritrichomonas foetus]|eukprot:OHS96246.1 hypothetical protein TRFO_37602 [Tritrichomonas foetus]
MDFFQFSEAFAVSPRDPATLQQAKVYFQELKQMTAAEDLQTKINKFDEYLTSCIEFMKNDIRFAQKNILQRIFLFTIQQSELYKISNEILLKTIEVLFLSYSYSPRFRINVDDTIPIICQLVSTQKDKEKIESNSSPFLKALFSNSDFLQSFIYKDGPLLIVEQILINKEEEETHPWVSKLFLSCFSKSSITKADTSSFLAYFGKKETVLKTNSNPNKVQFLVDFFIDFSLKANKITYKYSQKAYETHAFENYCILVSKLHPNLWKCYIDTFILVNDKYIDFCFCKALFNVCVDIPEIRQCSFNLLAPLFSKNPKEGNTLNEYFPLRKVFNDFDIPYQEKITLLAALDGKMSTLVVQCFQPLFMSLKEEPLENSSFYSILLSIIQNQLNLKCCTESDLFKFGFLDAFIFSPSTEILSQIMQTYIEIKDLILRMSKLKESFEIHDKLFQTIILTSKYFKSNDGMFLIICANLFSFRPSVIKIKSLLEYISSTKDTNLCNLLLTTLTKSAVSETFVEAKGLEWIEKSFASGLITIDTFAGIIASIVVQHRFDEIDSFILSLPKSHKLFSLSKSIIERIVYGMNRSKFRPIRVYSLFHLLQTPKEIDPYNAWILGKYSLDLLIKNVTNPSYNTTYNNGNNNNNSIYEVKLINDIGNRYLCSKHVEQLMKQPYELGPFCNLNYDHFPLYQFFQGRDELKISQNFKAMAFWIKFSGEINQRNYFFRTNHITLSITPENELSVELEGKIVFSQHINPSEWHLIFIEQEDSFLSSSITLFIDSFQPFKLSKPTKGKFQFCSFLSISSNLMFLGPALRFFSDFEKLSDINIHINPNEITHKSNNYNNSSNFDLNNHSLFGLIKVKGPGFLGNICKDEEVILPTEFHVNPNISIPSTCVSVPYFGLPYHFLSPQKNYELFKFLENTKNKLEFEKMFTILLNINAITIINSQNFWPKLLNTLKISDPTFITKDLFVKAIKTISNQMSFNHNIKILKNIIFNNQMWESVNNNLLIQVIFEYFKDVDWKSVPYFQWFISDIILKNYGDPNLVPNILKLHSRIPHVIFNLSDFLVIDKFGKYEIDPYLIKETIISSILTFLNENTVKIVKTYFTFNNLKHIFFLTPGINDYMEYSVKDYQISYQILHLILQISILSPNYLEITPFFIQKLSMLCNNQLICQDIFTFVSGSSDLSAQNLLNEKGLPLLLGFIWSSLIVIVHLIGYLSNDFSSFDYYYNYFNIALMYCEKFGKNIINSPLCIMMLSWWFPAAIKAPYNLHKHPPLQSSSWSEIYKTEGSLFQLIGYILDGFSIPLRRMKTNEDSNNEITNDDEKNVYFEKFDSEQTKNFLSSSIYADFMYEILLLCNINQFKSIFSSFILNAPFVDTFWVKDFSSSLILVFLSKCGEKLPFNFPNEEFLNYLRFIVGKKAIQTDIKVFALKLLTNPSFYRYSSIIDDILFDLFANSDGENISLLIDVFLNPKTIFKSIITHSSNAWFYLLKIKFCPEDYLLTILQLSKKDYELYKTDQYQKNLQDKYEKKKTEIQNAYDSVVNDLTMKLGEFKDYMNNFQHTVLANLNQLKGESEIISKKIESQSEELCFSLSLSQEENNWKQYLSILKENESEIFTFDPKSYFISSNCLPFCVPRQIKPSILQNEKNSAISNFKTKFILPYSKKMNEKRNENFFQYFVTHFEEQFGKIEYFGNCELVCYEIHVPSILCIFQSNFVLITFSKLKNITKDNLNQNLNLNIGFGNPNNLPEIVFLSILKSSSFGPFIEAVFNHQFGNTTIFSTRVVLIFSFTDLMKVQLTGSRCLFWTFSSGHFVLNLNNENDISNNNGFKEMVSTSEKQLPSFLFFSKIEKLDELTKNWSDGNLTNEELLFYLNGISGYSFVDLQKFPKIPSVGQFKGVNSFIPSLLFDSNDNIKSTSSIFSLHEEELFLNQVNISKFIFKEFQIRLGKKSGQNTPLISDFEAFHISQQVKFFKINPQPKNNSITKLTKNQIGNMIERVCFVKNSLKMFSPLEFLICKDFVAEIDCNSMSFAIYKYNLKELNKEQGNFKVKIFSVIDHFFFYTKSINISSNGLFAVVDFDFGISRVYRILYTNDHPYGIQFACDFSFTKPVKSIISGSFSLVASLMTNQIILWDASNASIHRIIKLNEPIKIFNFDESDGIWIASNSRISYFSFNAELIAEISLNILNNKLENEYVNQIKNNSKCINTNENCIVTSLATCQSSMNESYAIFGLDDGRVGIASPRYDLKDIELKMLNSTHKSRITSINIQNNFGAFVTADADGKALFWSAIGANCEKLNIFHFEKCNICKTKPPKYICSCCNMAACIECGQSLYQSFMCKTCESFRNYFY